MSRDILGRVNGFFASVKDVSEVLSHLFTIAAIVISGVWGYKIFIEERRSYPQATLSHAIKTYEIAKDIILVQVKLKIENTGNTLLILESSRHQIQQVSPLIGCSTEENCAITQINSSLSKIDQSTDRYSWPKIKFIERKFDAPLEIEPSETEYLDLEFTLPSSLEVVRLYSYFKNQTKSKNNKEIGWSDAIIYKIGETP